MRDKKMKSLFVTTAILILCFGKSVSAKDCFLVQEKEKILRSEGQCQTAYAPQSTFKIALSLMGFDSGILLDETKPSFPFKAEYSAGINVCKGDHNAKTWMRDSCVWFSQVLTAKLGMEKFRQYVNDFNYGNKDVSGDPKKNNGLEKAWLNSSILITPHEQIQFLQKVMDKKLPLSAKAFEMTQKILFIQELSGGWKLYGKTGNGHYKDELQQGWFVGWIEKNNRKLAFVHHIVDDSKQSTYASFRSKNEALTKLWYLIDDLEK
jgi:beta-lactamase class D OXA-29